VRNNGINLRTTGKVVHLVMISWMTRMLNGTNALQQRVLQILGFV